MYRAFSHDVTVAIFVLQNNETAAMLVFQDNLVELNSFFYVNPFFCSNKSAEMLAKRVKTLYSSSFGKSYVIIACCGEIYGR